MPADQTDPRLSSQLVPAWCSADERLCPRRWAFPNDRPLPSESSRRCAPRTATEGSRAEGGCERPHLFGWKRVKDGPDRPEVACSAGLDSPTGRHAAFPLRAPGSGALGRLYRCCSRISLRDPIRPPRTWVGGSQPGMAPAGTAARRA